MSEISSCVFKINPHPKKLGQPSIKKTTQSGSIIILNFLFSFFIFKRNPHAAVAAQLRMKIGYGFPLKACGNDSPLNPKP